MTREALEALLGYLGSSDEDAVKEYRRLRLRLIKILEIRSIGYRLRATPEDLADEAIYRVAGKLEQGLEIRARDPFNYFCGVARRVLQEVARKERKAGDSLEDNDVAVAAPAPEQLDEERHRCLDGCLARLAVAERELILQFYRVDRGKKRIAHRKQLAASLGLTVNALRIRAHRLRHQRLGPCVLSCLDRVGSKRRDGVK